MRLPSHFRPILPSRISRAEVAIDRAHKGTRIIPVVAGRHIRIITTDGELLRDFEL